MSFKPTIIDAILSLKPDAKVIIKDEDGGIPINEDINHFEMGILVKQLIKGFPHKNNKIYPNRYDFINIKK